MFAVVFLLTRLTYGRVGVAGRWTRRTSSDCAGRTIRRMTSIGWTSSRTSRSKSRPAWFTKPAGSSRPESALLGSVMVDQRTASLAKKDIDEQERLDRIELVQKLLRSAYPSMVGQRS